MTSKLPPALFVADAPALDFINSRAMPSGEIVDWLQSGADFLAWLEQAKLVPAQVIAHMRAEARPAEIDAVARQARQLRDWFRDFVVAHMGRPLTAKAASESHPALAPLQQILARDSLFYEIVPRRSGRRDPHQGAFDWRLTRRWDDPGTLLLPLAAAMGEFVCSADFSRVKPCEGSQCMILFLDQTRSGARRWCSMALCGNRAKQAAHRARAKRA
jgi:predicted RNA-binding Zn ribbon-like protein